MARERHPDLNLTERNFVFFGGRSLDALAFRSYEIYLLSELVANNKNTSAPTEALAGWNMQCDIVLAYLVTILGFENIMSVGMHPIWDILTSKKQIICSNQAANLI